MRRKKAKICSPVGVQKGVGIMAWRYSPVPPPHLHHCTFLGMSEMSSRMDRYVQRDPAKMCSHWFDG